MAQPPTPSKAVAAANRDLYEGEAASTYLEDSGLYPGEELLVDALFPPAPAQVLDVGCGAGRTTAEFTRRGYEVTAFDLSATMAALTHRQAPSAAVLHADATAMPFADDSFDATMFSFNGIDLIWPPEGRRTVLDELRRVTRPGGAVLVSSHSILGHIGRDLSRGPRVAVPRLAKLAAKQVRNRALRHNYWRLGGATLYAGTPRATLALTRAAGFLPESVIAAADYKGPVSCALDGLVPAGASVPEVGLAALTRVGAHVQYGLRSPR